MRPLTSSLLLLLITLSSCPLWGAAGEKCSVPSQRVQCGAYSCNKTTLECMRCTEDKQCWDPAMFCDTSDGKCKVQSLKKTFEERPGGAIGAMLVGLSVCSIAVIAGVGGGGILVPLYMVLLGIPSITAVALSQATITGQSFFNICIQLRRHHPEYQKPKPTRPVINWVLLAFWLPISLVGTMYGNLAGKVVPDWFRLGMLFVLLSYVLYRTILRLKAQREADRQHLLEKEKEAIERAERDASMSTADKEIQSIQSPHHLLEDGREKPPPEDQKPASAQYPLVPILIAVFTFLPLFGMNFAKSHAVDCSSIGFWLIVVLATVYNTGVSLGYRFYLRGLHLKIIMDEEDPEKVPFRWNWKTTMLFPFISMFAGGAASLLGIGGGLILSFLLLEAGMVPEEQSATSGMTTFLVALESLLQFVIQGAVPLDYGGLFLGVGACSTAIGQLVFVREIRKRGWRFLIIMSLAFIMIGSMVTLTAVGVRDTVVLLQHHGTVGFGSLCPPQLHFGGNSSPSGNHTLFDTQDFSLMNGQTAPTESRHFFSPLVF